MYLLTNAVSICSVKIFLNVVKKFGCVENLWTCSKPASERDNMYIWGLIDIPGQWKWPPSGDKKFPSGKLAEPLRGPCVLQPSLLWWILLVSWRHVDDILAARIALQLLLTWAKMATGTTWETDLPTITRHVYQKLSFISSQTHCNPSVKDWDIPDEFLQSAYLQVTEHLFVSFTIEGKPLFWNVACGVLAEALADTCAVCRPTSCSQ